MNQPQPTASTVNLPERSPSSTFIERAAALVEVVVVFAVVPLSYRSLKHFTELGRLEVAAGLNFSTGSVMILFTVAMLLLFRRSFNEYGLTLNGWRYNLNIGLFSGVLSVALAAVVVRFAPIHLETHGPPDLMTALVFGVVGLVATFLLIWFLMRERRLIKSVRKQ